MMSRRPPSQRSPVRLAAAGSGKLSDQLERWLAGDGKKTLGGLIHAFGDKSFAILLVVLLGIPALPIPTGGATHVFEIVAVVITVQLIAGRHEVWLPQRWSRLELAGARQQRFITGLIRLIRWLEYRSRPRLRFLFHRRFTDIVFGTLALAGTVAAFLAPPFSGLDTLPALGVVLLSLSVLLEDILITVAGLVLATLGILLEIVLGEAVINGISSIL